MRQETNTQNIKEEAKQLGEGYGNAKTSRPGKQGTSVARSRETRSPPGSPSWLPVPRKRQGPLPASAASEDGWQHG